MQENTKMEEDEYKGRINVFVQEISQERDSGILDFFVLTNF